LCVREIALTDCFAEITRGREESTYRISPWHEFIDRHYLPDIELI
jgi:hypothetical protein